MCVIICCENEFPSLSTLESAESLNSHGGGIAWIEKGKVHYKKGLKSKQIFEMTKKIKLPAIIHFRIASIGGVVDELCHPFPIDNEASVDLNGSCDSALFHNGTWSGWQEVCLNTVIKKNIMFPSGKWSDSRAMAWLADKYGIDMLNLIPTENKIAILTKDGIRKFGRFVEIDKVLCSNDYFEDRFDMYSSFGVNYHKGNVKPMTEIIAGRVKGKGKKLSKKEKRKAKNEEIRKRNKQSKLNGDYTVEITHEDFRTQVLRDRKQNVEALDQEIGSPESKIKEMREELADIEEDMKLTGIELDEFPEHYKEMLKKQTEMVDELETNAKDTEEWAKEYANHNSNNYKKSRRGSYDRYYDSPYR